MPKINQEEYEILKRLDDKWKWIARDRDTGKLPYSDMVHVYEEKPFKTGNVWTVGYGTEKLGKNLFQFIQWEDDEPYNIVELIGEYEYSTEHVSHVVNERVKALGKAWSESEETEVKSIQYLIDKWENYKNGARTVADSKAIEHSDMFISDLNQLDEPDITELDALNRLAENVQFSADEIASHLEKLSAYNGEVTYGEQGTLSQKWIDGKKIGVRNRIPFHMDVDYAVPEEDLQNLLVPKQEEITEEQVTEYLRERSMTAVDSTLVYRENLDNKMVIEKPTIPQFVADWLEEYKEDELIITAGTVIGNRRFPKDTKVGKWLNEDHVKNSEIFAQAWLAYPNIEVEEEEQKYYVDLETAAYVAKWDGDGSVQIYTDSVLGSDEYELHLTEQEIKDYDKRFWPFAKPVEELEE